MFTVMITVHWGLDSIVLLFQWTQRKFSMHKCKYYCFKELKCPSSTEDFYMLSLLLANAHRHQIKYKKGEYERKETALIQTVFLFTWPLLCSTACVFKWYLNSMKTQWLASRGCKCTTLSCYSFIKTYTITLKLILWN